MAENKGQKKYSWEDDSLSEEVKPEPQAAAKKYNWEDEALSQVADEAQAILPQPTVAESGLGDMALSAVMKGLEEYEKRISAPARASYLSIAAGEPEKAIEAFKAQYGEPVETAPTATDIARVAGVPETEVYAPYMPVGAPGSASEAQAAILGQYLAPCFSAKY